MAPRRSDSSGSDDLSIAKGLKKGPWSAAEDAILMEYVRKNGEGNWNAVQKNTGLVRCGKSCRLRWANHLRPNLKKGSFSPEEERLILELHARYGNKWARMASQLPGRTDNEIKNYWNTRSKRRQRAGLPLYPQGIQNEGKTSRPTSGRHKSGNQRQNPQTSSPLPSLLSSSSSSSLSSFKQRSTRVAENHPFSSLFDHINFSTRPNFQNVNPHILPCNIKSKPKPLNDNTGHPGGCNSHGFLSLSLPPISPLAPLLLPSPTFQFEMESFKHNSSTMIITPPSQSMGVSHQMTNAELPSIQTLATTATAESSSTTTAMGGENNYESVVPSTKMNDCMLLPSRGHSGLLEDLLEEAKALIRGRVDCKRSEMGVVSDNGGDDRPILSNRNASPQSESKLGDQCPGQPPGRAQADKEALVEEMSSMDEDLLSLLNFPLTNFPDWYRPNPDNRLNEH